MKNFNVNYDSFFGVAELNALAGEDLSWTPYFPIGEELVTVGFKEKFDPSLRDGVRVSSPYYRVTFSLPKVGTASTGTCIRLLENEKLTFQVQGVLPLGAEESDFFKRIKFKDWVSHSLTLAKVKQKMPGPLGSDEKKFYSLWASGNAVQARALDEKIQEFLKSVEAP